VENQRYRITVAYDGTAYAGWQVQLGARTVQAELEAVLLRLGGGEIKVNGSGRTDAGVHARGQVAHFDFPRPFAVKDMLRALNAWLPVDVRVLDVDIVPGDFHARRHAVGKEYRYFIWNHPVMLPTARLYHLQVPHALDVKAMQDAGRLLEGTHDFASFSANPSRVVESTVRTISSLEVTASEAVITLAVRGDGFLYKMVRSITGWLIRVGQGEVPACQTADILASGIRTATVPTAPPQGLFLWRVWYPKHSALNALGILAEAVLFAAIQGFCA